MTTPQSTQPPAGQPPPAPPPALEDRRWQAVLARSAAPADGFVYAVRTTGVYARPGTAATRLPRRENVEFFDSPEQAEAAGYRPSRRLGAAGAQARARRAEAIAQACRLLDQSEGALPLRELASRLGLSPYHLHRLFKAETGLTPKAYAMARRAHRLRQELGRRPAPPAAPGARADAGAKAPSITHALYDAGFASASRFYSHAGGLLGMQPSHYRDGGAGQAIRFAVAQCSLGAIAVARSARGICAILLGDDADRLLRELQDQFANAALIGADAGFEQWVAEVIGLVEAPALGLALPLDIRGTAFQERVWRALQQIPPGRTASYSEIARAIGAPHAARAVAQACAANRLAVAVPCHRVVRRDGDLSGYRWGVERKRELLAREKNEDGQALDTPDSRDTPGRRAAAG